MTKENLYWMAPGVVMIDGKEYGAEMPLPVNKIDKDVLVRWEKAGKVGRLISSAKAFCEDCANLADEIKGKDVVISELQCEVRRLESEIKEMADKKAAHVKAHAHIDELSKKNEKENKK